MSFIDGVIELKTDFKKKKNIEGNELWLGFTQKEQLNQYLKEQKELCQFTNQTYSVKGERIEVLGLKVRFENEYYSHFSVDYNPHYFTDKI